MWLRGVLFALPFVALGSLAAPDLPHGVQSGDMDITVRPGDDFYAYANGGWLKRTSIPVDRASWGSFSTLSDTSQTQVLDIITKLGLAKTPWPEGSNEQKVLVFYQSYMDEGGIEVKGFSPIKPALDGVMAVKNKTELARALGLTLRADVDAMNNVNFHTENLFGLWVAPAFKDPEHYVGYLLQGGLGLPDREYYVSDKSQMVTIRAAYIAYIARMLALAGVSDAGSKAEAIMTLETEIARTHESRTTSEDVQQADNPWSRADFEAKAPGLDWNAYFDGAGLSGVAGLTVWQPSGVTGIASLVASQSLDVWKDWLCFHLLNHFAVVLPRAVAEQHFTLYGATLSGTLQQATRWKRAVDITNGALGWAVGKLFVTKYFPPFYKTRVQGMVKKIVSVFSRRIDHLSWMTPQTKAKAQEKLAKLYVGIGFPETWRSYDGYDVRAGDAFGNLERAEIFDYRYWVGRIGTVVDRAQWCMTPQTVNAVNLPMQNALNFPAAVLNPPFFDAKADEAFNYGAIGAIIGHEISHSFDDEGRQFGASGALEDWWTEEDSAHFQASAAQLAAQYDGYKPFADLGVNGRQTLSEYIADVAGLSVAYDAWAYDSNNQKETTLDGLSGPQRFYLAYAQSRQIVVREAALRRQLLTDGHAPSQYRVDTVRNEDAWYDAFSVSPDETLYLGPSKRVRIW